MSVFNKLNNIAEASNIPHITTLNQGKKYCQSLGLVLSNSRDWGLMLKPHHQKWTLKGKPITKKKIESASNGTMSDYDEVGGNAKAMHDSLKHEGYEYNPNGDKPNHGRGSATDPHGYGRSDPFSQGEADGDSAYASEKNSEEATLTELIGSIWLWWYIFVPASIWSAIIILSTLIYAKRAAQDSLSQLGDKLANGKFKKFAVPMKPGTFKRVTFKTKEGNATVYLKVTTDSGSMDKFVIVTLANSADPDQGFRKKYRIETTRLNFDTLHDLKNGAGNIGKQIKAAMEDFTKSAKAAAEKKKRIKTAAFMTEEAAKKINFSNINIHKYEATKEEALAFIAYVCKRDRLKFKGNRRKLVDSVFAEAAEKNMKDKVLLMLDNKLEPVGNDNYHNGRQYYSIKSSIDPFEAIGATDVDTSRPRREPLIRDVEYTEIAKSDNQTFSAMLSRKGWKTPKDSKLKPGNFARVITVSGSKKPNVMVMWQDGKNNVVLRFMGWKHDIHAKGRGASLKAAFNNAINAAKKSYKDNYSALGSFAPKLANAIAHIAFEHDDKDKPKGKGKGGKKLSPIIDKSEKKAKGGAASGGGGGGGGLPVPIVSDKVEKIAAYMKRFKIDPENDEPKTAVEKFKNFKKMMDKVAGGKGKSGFRLPSVQYLHHSLFGDGKKLSPMASKLPKGKLIEEITDRMFSDVRSVQNKKMIQGDGAQKNKARRKREDKRRGFKGLYHPDKEQPGFQIFEKPETDAVVSRLQGFADIALFKTTKRQLFSKLNKKHGLRLDTITDVINILKKAGAKDKKKAVAAVRKTYMTMPVEAIETIMRFNRQNSKSQASLEIAKGKAPAKSKKMAVKVKKKTPAKKPAKKAAKKAPAKKSAPKSPAKKSTRKAPVARAVKSKPASAPKVAAKTAAPAKPSSQSKPANNSEFDKTNTQWMHDPRVTKAMNRAREVKEVQQVSVKAFNEGFARWVFKNKIKAPVVVPENRLYSFTGTAVYFLNRWGAQYFAWMDEFADWAMPQERASFVALAAAYGSATKRKQFPKFKEDDPKSKQRIEYIARITKQYAVRTIDELDTRTGKDKKSEHINRSEDLDKRTSQYKAILTRLVKEKKIAKRELVRGFIIGNAKARNMTPSAAEIKSQEDGLMDMPVTSLISYATLRIGSKKFWIKKIRKIDAEVRKESPESRSADHPQRQTKDRFKQRKLVDKERKQSRKMSKKHFREKIISKLTALIEPETAAGYRSAVSKSKAKSARKPVKKATRKATVKKPVKKAVKKAPVKKMAVKVKKKAPAKKAPAKKPSNRMQPKRLPATFDEYDYVADFLGKNKEHHNKASVALRTYLEGFAKEAIVDYVVKYKLSKIAPSSLNKTDAINCIVAPVMLKYRKIGEQPAAKKEYTEEKYKEALESVLRDKRASPSYVMRVIRCTYQVAEEMMKRMEQEGHVTAPDANGIRKMAEAKPFKAYFKSGKNETADEKELFEYMLEMDNMDFRYAIIHREFGKPSPLYSLTDVVWNMLRKYKTLDAAKIATLQAHVEFKHKPGK